MYCFHAIMLVLLHTNKLYSTALCRHSWYSWVLVLEAETILWHLMHAWNFKDAFIAHTALYLNLSTHPNFFHCALSYSPSLSRGNYVQQNKSCELCQTFEKARISWHPYKTLTHWQAFTSMTWLKKVRCLLPSSCQLELFIELLRWASLHSWIWDSTWVRKQIFILTWLYTTEHLKKRNHFASPLSTLRLLIYFFKKA